MPRELSKVTLAGLRHRTSDLLQIDAVHVVPKAPYHLRTTDVVSIQVQGALPDAPLGGIYPIEAGGIVNLGPPYGSVTVADLTVYEAEVAVEQHLRTLLREPTCR